MENIIFVTGTDTDVGKTVISCALIEYLASQKLRVAPFKPVSAGAIRTVSGLINDDAQQLLNTSNCSFDYHDINPYVYEEPIAPHIAAEKTGQPIDSRILTRHLTRLSEGSDVVVVEGAGGWQVPLSATETIADWIGGLACPVILVVGLRVGCINHAVLSYKDILRGPNQIVGWIANTVTEDVGNVSEIISYIDHIIDAPLLGTVPFLENDMKALPFIDFSEVYSK